MAAPLCGALKKGRKASLLLLGLSLQTAVEAESQAYQGFLSDSESARGFECGFHVTLAGN